MKVLVTGADGQLGSSFIKNLPESYQTCGVDKSEFNIFDTRATIDHISAEDPDVIIHSAAFTDVDGCEENPNRAFRVNSLGTRNIAIAARSTGARVVYISTDYVFGDYNKKIIREYDETNPESCYGKSKLLGERYLKEQLSDIYVCRIAWLYGLEGDNFVKTMLRLAAEREQISVVGDQIGSPTWTKNVVEQVSKLLGSRKYGTYHCTSRGSCSWYEFAREIFLQAGYRIQQEADDRIRLVPETPSGFGSVVEDYGTLEPIELVEISSEEFDRPAPRPNYSVLDNYMLRLENIDQMPHWKEALEGFFDELDFA